MGQVSPRQMLEAQAEKERQKLLPKRVKGEKIMQSWEIQHSNPLPALVDSKFLESKIIATPSRLDFSPVKRRQDRNSGQVLKARKRRQRKVEALLKGRGLCV